MGSWKPSRVLQQIFAREQLAITVLFKASYEGSIMGF